MTADWHELVSLPSHYSALCHHPLTIRQRTRGAACKHTTVLIGHTSFLSRRFVTISGLLNVGDAVHL